MIPYWNSISITVLSHLQPPFLQLYSSLKVITNQINIHVGLFWNVWDKRHIFDIIGLILSTFKRSIVQVYSDCMMKKKEIIIKRQYRLWFCTFGIVSDSPTKYTLFIDLLSCSKTLIKSGYENFLIVHIFNNQNQQNLLLHNYKQL